MKILFYGDSITDAERNREKTEANVGLGNGYVFCATTALLNKDLEKYEIYNRGISGNRVVDLYARIKRDCWNLEPDVISILIGVNDVWHEIAQENGVEIDRFENVYRIMLSETVKRLPNAKIIICEPFVLPGTATEEKYDRFLAVKEYAKVVKRLAEEFNLYFVELQKPYDEAAKRYGNTKLLRDGVHPTTEGAAVLANEWMKVFEKIN